MMAAIPLAHLTGIRGKSRGSGYVTKIYVYAMYCSEIEHYPGNGIKFPLLPPFFRKRKSWALFLW